MTQELVLPYKIFFDADGTPLDAGYIYIGEENLNPQTNPITVYLDSAATIQAEQPLRTLSGFISRNGTAAKIFINQDKYSVVIRDKNGELVFSSLSNEDLGAVDATVYGFLDWSATTTYNIPDIVVGSDNNFYQSTANTNLNVDPTNTPASLAYWKQIEILGYYNVNISYSQNDVVLYNGIFYRSLINSNLNNQPDISPTSWGSTDLTVQTSEYDYAESLVRLIHPDQSKGLGDLLLSGVNPINESCNYGNLPDGIVGEVAVGSDDTSVTINLADVSGSTYLANGFKLSKTTTIEAVWVYLYKVGNPTNNLQLFIFDDSSGSPNAVITNGDATSQSGRIHSDNTGGGWVKFVFSTDPSITQDTQYHIVLRSSGSVDASNYWVLFNDNAGRYPHGTVNVGDGTPTWTPDTAKTLAFLIETQNKVLDSGLSGFDGALTCFSGSPLDQSPAFTFKNEVLNHQEGTIHIVGTGFTKEKTIYDSGLTIDMNRIVVRCNASTGFIEVALYEEDETEHTITGTTDLSTGNHVIDVIYRCKNDGADYLKLFIDSVSEGTELTGQSFGLTQSFLSGNSLLGCGFGKKPSWTDKIDMSNLPSIDGYTYTGTATEGNVFVSAGGLLYQVGSGYASTDTGYYTKTTTFVNATGWLAAWSVKVTGSAASLTSASSINFKDGSYRLDVNLYTNRVALSDGTNRYEIAIDLQSDFVNFVLSVKGADFYLFANNKLIFNGENKLVVASATNSIEFGDLSSTAGVNGESVWEYVKYIESEFLPEYTAASFSELAFYNADKESILSGIYNSASILPVKRLAGVSNNYITKTDEVINNDESQFGVLHLQDQKPQNTASGTFTAGAWRTRVLNTVLINTIEGASLESNQVTIPAGTYKLVAWGCAYAVNRSRLRLYNITDSTEIVLGIPPSQSSGGGDSYSSDLICAFTIDNTKTFELQHFCQTSRGTNGFGLTINGAGQVEVYAEFFLEKTS